MTLTGVRSAVPADTSSIGRSSALSGTRAGLRQVELAARLGRPQPFISFVDRGERRIEVIEFYAIIKALGTDRRSRSSIGSRSCRTGWE